MSETELVALASRANELMNRALAGEAEARAALLDLIHPDFASTTPLAEMQGGTVRGGEAAASLLEEIRDSWAEFETEVSDLEQIGSCVVWESVTRARSRGAGVPYESPAPLAALLEFRAGLLYRWDVFADRAEALARAREREAAA